MCAVLVLE